MAKTKILKAGWANTPNAFYVSAMRTTDDRNQAVESANQQWQQATALFHTTFQAVDDAYQRSLASLTTADIALKDEERDQWGQVIEQVAKQWARMPDLALAIHGRRVYQVFSDIGFRSSEALVAVRPTDSVDAKKEYALVQIDGSSSGEITPVTPE